MDVANLSLLYQDHYLLIVNKPAGVVIHPTYKHADDTLWDALLLHLAQQGHDDWQPPNLPDELEWAGAPVHIQEMLRAKRRARWYKEDGLLARPCLLHRLDKDTSGVVALARTERSRRHLVKQFHEHTIVKRYLALVQKGSPSWTQPRATFSAFRRKRNGDIQRIGQGDTTLALASLGSDVLVLDGPLQRDPDERRRCIVGPDGQHAMTEVRVLAAENEFLLLDARPVTGRTHQIRAHLAAFGYAILGDALYACPAEEGTAASALKRQFLHASSLTFRRYPDDVPCTFVAPLTDDLGVWMKDYFPSGLGVLYADTTIPT